MSRGRDEPTPLPVLEERLRADAEDFAAGKTYVPQASSTTMIG